MFLLKHSLSFTFSRVANVIPILMVLRGLRTMAILRNHLLPLGAQGEGAQPHPDLI